MKITLRQYASACAMAATLVFTPTGFSQGVATTTTTATTETAGTISDFGNDNIVIRSETATAPITYHYSKTTTYVDDTGAPVSVETIKSGLPVTVHYVKQADGMVADRVIVHRKKVISTAPATAVEEHKSSSTTTVVK